MYKNGDEMVTECEGLCREVKLCEYGPDPYDEDINGNDTPIWECSDCRYESAQDI